MSSKTLSKTFCRKTVLFALTTQYVEYVSSQKHSYLKQKYFLGISYDSFIVRTNFCGWGQGGSFYPKGSNIEQFIFGNEISVCFGCVFCVYVVYTWVCLQEGVVLVGIFAMGIFNVLIFRIIICEVTFFPTGVYWVPKWVQSLLLRLRRKHHYIFKQAF